MIDQHKIEKKSGNGKREEPSAFNIRYKSPMMINTRLETVSVNRGKKKEKGPGEQSIGNSISGARVMTEKPFWSLGGVRMGNEKSRRGTDGRKI